MVIEFRSAFGAALLVAAALGGCSRASSPPPASEPVPAATAATTSAPPALAPDAATASSPAPAAPAPDSSAPVSATSAAPNPWTSPGNCSSPEKAGNARERATCEAREEFRVFVAGRQSCQSSADCTIVTGSCPFGCFVPVAKASRGATVAKLGELGDRLDKAGNRCVYRCMSPPTEACVEGRCSTEAR